MAPLFEVDTTEKKVLENERRWSHKAYGKTF